MTSDRNAYQSFSLVGKEPVLGTDKHATLRLSNTYHVAPLPCCAVALGSTFQDDMVGARQGHGMGTAWLV